MKDNTIIATLKQIKKLLKYVNPLSEGRTDMNGMICLDHHAPDRDGATLSVDPKSGLCTLTSWLESGHNGSSYDTQEEVLSPEIGHKALNEILQRLENSAMEKARKEALEDFVKNAAQVKLKSVLK